MLKILDYFDNLEIENTWRNLQEIRLEKHDLFIKGFNYMNYIKIIKISDHILKYCFTKEFINRMKILQKFICEYQIKDHLIKYSQSELMQSHIRTNLSPSIRNKEMECK